MAADVSRVDASAAPRDRATGEEGPEQDQCHAPRDPAQPARKAPNKISVTRSTVPPDGQSSTVRSSASYLRPRSNQRRPALSPLARPATLERGVVALSALRRDDLDRGSAALSARALGRRVRRSYPECRMAQGRIRASLNVAGIAWREAGRATPLIPQLFSARRLLVEARKSTRLRQRGNSWQ